MSPSSSYERRWLILALISIAQLMIVLDLTIVNIALPGAQRDLGFSNDERQWIITAHALAFGSLLLPGGKLGDLFGRKWAFVGGLFGFATASAVGGAEGSFGVLVAARGTQGVFAALLAPGALALLATTFSDPAARGKAFGIFGAIAGGGSAVGLLLGGILTQWLNWRWCLYVNLVIAVPTAIAALRLIENVAQPGRPRLDLVGTALATSGLFALVYGFSNSELHSWGHPVTIVALALAVVLLAAFVFVESRVEHPLLPLRVVTDRVRGGSGAGASAPAPRSSPLDHQDPATTGHLLRWDFVRPAERGRKERHDKRGVRPPGVRRRRGQGHRGVDRLLQPGRCLRRRIRRRDLPRA
jgi:MFS family permease